MLTILLTVTLWGAATEGAPQDGAASRARPSLPPGVQPGQYVQAVVTLYNRGKADEAGPYIQAANDFRHMLTPEQSATLDRYAALCLGGAAAPADPAVARVEAAGPAAPARDRAVGLVAQARQALAAGQVAEAQRLAREAESLGVPFAAEEDNPARVLADCQRATSGGPLGRGGSGKAQAAWMLKQAREQMRLGNFDQAAALVAQAKTMDLRWTLFDDTPKKVEDDLARMRPDAVTASPGGAPATGDHRAAKARLKEARTALEAGDYERAEAIALEVGSWGQHFGVLEDSPSKIAAQARSLRKRQTRRGGAAGTVAAQQYEATVQQARQMLAAGRIDEAEAAARQAQQLNVVPPVTADRAEAVLHDVAMVRARGQAGANDPAVATAGAVAQSAELERQASDLLAQHQLDAARAKFEEAERLHAAESGLDDPAPVALLDAPAAPTPAAEAPAQPVPPDPFQTVPPAAPVEMTTLPAGDGLEQARELLAAGNYRAAREAAEQAKAAGAGLEADNLLAQIAQSQQQAAYSLYEAALVGLRKGEVERSRALLMELSAGDLDESMLQKVQDLLMSLPQPGAAAAPNRLKAIEDAEAVKAQQLNAEVGTRVAEARRLLETDPQKAIDLLEQTRNTVKNAGLSDAVTRTMLRRLEVAVELARKDKLAFDEKMKDRAYREQIEQKRLRMIEYDKQKKERFKQYMDRAQQAQAESNWLEAEKYANLAAQVDPNEIAATALATVARINRHMDRDKQLRDDSNESFLTAMQDVSEAGIVPPGVHRNAIDYGKGWAALSARRQRTNARLEPQKSPRIVEIEAILNKPITLPNSDQMSLREAIKYLSEYTGLDIMPDHGALAEEGLTLDTPVNLTAVKNVKLKSVLKYMLAPLHLSYTIEREGGFLLITSPQANRSHMYPVVYSVADLVMSPHNRKKGLNNGLPYVAPPGMAQADPNALQAQAALMSGLPGAPPEAAPTPGAVGAVPTADGWGSGSGERDFDFDPLIRLIKTSIAPGTWSDDHTPYSAEMRDVFGQGQGFGAGAGGDVNAANEGVGSITPFFLNISLIIRQTAEVHEEIVELLRQLRRLQDLQVSIEVRFITVSDSFFELIGVDFDFNIQSDVVGRKSSFAVPAAGAGNNFTGGTTGATTTGATAATAAAPLLINPFRDHAYGRQPLVVGTQGPTNSVTTPNFSPNLGIPFQQNTLDAITPFNIIPNVTANLGVAFLSDLEVFLFLTAIQGDTRANLVQAPKVTSFNGAPAFVSNFLGRNFVQSIQPIIGAGAVAFQPQIGTFPDGVQLFVTPVVSADRRYVRMSLSPIFTTFLQFDNFIVPAAVGGGGIGGASATINGQIQLPVFTITTVATTVTVPDGGTVLLGGVKRLREERRELGVPILAKTPLIDRLFRNIGIGRQTDSLMVMVTPRIIILEEEEERLAPPNINITF
jgi:type II secretory pathway component GspD/PulD (secretin)